MIYIFFRRRGDFMSTKSIVPRGSGEGSLGRSDKHWGTLYTNSCPIVNNLISTHNSSSSAHPSGIAGNAATASKFRTAVKINGTNFDGSENVHITFREDHETFSYSDMLNLYNNA